MLLVIDGPEKVGKSSLIKSIESKSPSFRVAHTAIVHYRYPLNQSVLKSTLILSARDDILVIMDRSWASDVIYSRLVRQTESREPDWWYEWALGLPSMTLGERVMILPPHRLAQLEDNDHQLSWDDERKAFYDYATKWKWMIVDPTDEKIATEKIIDKAIKNFWAGPRAPIWSGSRAPRLLWVGETRNENARGPLAWAPMTSRFWRLEVESRQAEILASWPHVAATNIKDTVIVKEIALRTKHVVAYGHEAQKVLNMTNVEKRPHPAYQYRWRIDHDR